MFRSIGIFTHAEQPGEVRLVLGETLVADTINLPSLASFFTKLATHVLRSSESGHIDIFLPLAASGTHQINSLHFTLLRVSVYLRSPLHLMSGNNTSYCAFYNCYNICVSHKSCVVKLCNRLKINTKIGYKSTTLIKNEL